MDLELAEDLFEKLSNIVDYPLFDDTPRIALSATLAVSSMHLLLQFVPYVQKSSCWAQAPHYALNSNRLFEAYGHYIAPRKIRLESFRQN